MTTSALLRHGIGHAEVLLAGLTELADTQGHRVGVAANGRLVPRAKWGTNVSVPRRAGRRA
jgi:hypothetical protein